MYIGIATSEVMVCGFFGQIWKDGKSVSEEWERWDVIVV